MVDDRFAGCVQRLLADEVFVYPVEVVVVDIAVAENLGNVAIAK
jgi:hypothetical protein